MALTGDGKLVSLFAKTPNWLAIEKGRGLLDAFGYFDEIRKRRALYCTITTTRNTLGWQLVLDPDAERIDVAHAGVPQVTYSIWTLEKRLLEKHPATLFVRAANRGEGAAEEFRYDEVTLCREPSMASFLDLMEDDFVGLDFTLSERPNGNTRDHGYLWRIREYRIVNLYAYRRPLLGVLEA
jgi:hypothetical protein